MTLYFQLYNYKNYKIKPRCGCKHISKQTFNIKCQKRNKYGYA